MLISAGTQTNDSILIMDDEEMIREIITEILASEGYQVTSCSTGEEAITLYKEAKEVGTSFSAVIMDLTIPGGMGGKEAAQHILAFDPAACLITSSGYSNDPVMAEYADYGFRAAVIKPYSTADLVQAVQLARELQ
jgi:two-component system cell cycle sensor histidine kinase/response regulator CckA